MAILCQKSWGIGIYSFNKHLLRTYYVLNDLLVPGIQCGSKTHNLVPLAAYTVVKDLNIN